MIQSKFMYDIKQNFLKHKSTKLQYIMSFRSNSSIINSYRLSKMLQPTKILPHNQTINKTNDHEISDDYNICKSNTLLVDNGLIKCAHPGSYTFLPLGMRVLQKISKLIDKRLQNIDCQKILLPTLTEAKLWKQTGRFEKMKEELLHTHDRHKRLLIFR